MSITGCELPRPLCKVGRARTQRENAARRARGFWAAPVDIESMRKERLQGCFGWYRAWPAGGATRRGGGRRHRQGAVMPRAVRGVPTARLRL